jgi:uncharacterized protein
MPAIDVWSQLRYNNYTVMEFEFDPHKSESNRQKHGIDFVAAQDLWNDPLRVVIPVRTEDEERSLVIGTIGDKNWSAVVTTRGETVRIISVRRSRDEEKEIYES